MEPAADIPALVQRLRSSSRVAQLQALKRLTELARNDAGVHAIADAGGVPPLVQLLTASSSQAAQESAVVLLEAIIHTDATLGEAVVAAGGIPPLIAVLQRGSQLVQQAAAGALGMLAAHTNERGAPIAAPGAVETLVQLLLSKNEGTQQSAVVALFWFAQDSEPCSAAVAAAGAIPAVVQLIPVLHDKAVWLLAALARGSNERRNEIAAAGAGELLQQELVSGGEPARYAAASVFLELSCAEAGSEAVAAVAEAAGSLSDCLGSSDARCLLELLTALGNLTLDDPQPVQHLLHTGLLPALARCMHSSTTAVAAVAAWVVDVFASEIPAEQEAIGAACAPALIGLLGCKDQKAAMNAAWALHSLALECPLNQQAILAGGTFEALLGILQGTAGGGGSGSSVLKLRGAAAVAMTTLAHGSEQLIQAVGAAGTAAVIEQAATIWQADMASHGAATAAQAALNFLRESHAATTSRHEADVIAETAHQPAAAPPTRMCAAPGCGAKRGLHRCGGCGTVRYCSTACSKAHWRAHKAECRRLQAAAKEQQQPAA